MVRCLLIACLVWQVSCAARRAPDPPREAEELRVLVVLDTLRADHTSLCGYGLPTTPTLEALSRAGASFTCSAYSPSAWTVPSHASYFTGLTVPEHHVHFAQGSETRLMPWPEVATVRPLADSFETLAEVFAARGFKTAAISSNPLVSPLTGLHQGFGQVEASRPGHSWLTYRAVAQRAAAWLKRLRPNERGFLFVNFGDAHMPWQPVPPGLDWIEATPMFDPDPRNAFLTSQLPADASTRFLDQRTRLYDYGIHLADQGLKLLMDAIREQGRDRRLRLVVTSDHGEFLGEHRLIDHGVTTYEPTTRVPLLVLSSTGHAPPKLVPRMSALAAHDLVVGEPLSKAAREPTCFQYARREWLGTRLVDGDNLCDWISHWQGDLKWTRRCTKWWRVDLRTDPEELAPVEVAQDALPAQLRVVERDMEGSARLDVTVREDLRDALRAIGYAE